MSIRRGQIYFVNLDPTLGREQSGQRPVLVLSIDEINNRPLTVTVIVGTKGANASRNYPTNVRVPAEVSGLPLETVFLGFQVRSIDRSRFPAQASGKLPAEWMQRVEVAVKYCLGL